MAKGDWARIWANSAAGGDVVEPDTSKQDAGWAAGEKPPNFSFNWFWKKICNAFKALNDQGVFEYDATTTYGLDAIVVHSGVVYISNEAANQGNTPSATSEKWQVLRQTNITVGTTQPVNGRLGNLWLNTTTGVILVCTASAPTNTWIAAGDTVTVSGTAPTSPGTGKLWYDTTATVLAMKIWTGAAWAFVDHASIASIGTTPPTNPVHGTLWYSNALGILFIYYVDPDAGAAWVSTNGLPSTQPINAILHFQHREASGVSGQGITSGGWRTRQINTLVSNDITGASIDDINFTFTLPAGSYELDIMCTQKGLGKNVLQIYNITDTAVALLGINQGNDETTVHVRGKVTIAHTTVFAVQQRSTSSNNADGGGAACGFGVSEVYLDGFARQISI